MEANGYRVEATSGSITPSVCSRCGQKGHSNEHCNNQRVFFCWDCGRRNTKTTECCQRRQANSANDTPADFTTYPENPIRFDGSRILATIALGEELVTATINTGATKSFVSELYANELGTAENIIPCKTTIRMADGTFKTIKEALVMDIKLGDSYSKLPLLILPDVVDNVVLGMDYLLKAQAEISCGGQAITLRESEINVLAENSTEDSAKSQQATFVKAECMSDEDDEMAVLVSPVEKLFQKTSQIKQKKRDEEKKLNSGTTEPRYHISSFARRFYKSELCTPEDHIGLTPRYSMPTPPFQMSNADMSEPYSDSSTKTDMASEKLITTAFKYVAYNGKGGIELPKEILEDIRVSIARRRPGAPRCALLRTLNGIKYQIKVTRGGYVMAKLKE